MKKLDSLNHYLAILAELRPNKTLVVGVLAFILSSCHPYTSSKVMCPDGNEVMIRYSHANDTVAGIRKFLEIKRRQGTSEQYTVIRYPYWGGYAVQIKIPPEVMVTCRVTEVEHNILGIKWPLWNYVWKD